MTNQRKLRLDLQDLRVESFEPAAEDASRRGTVRGQETPATDTALERGGCACQTHDNTCAGSCAVSCPGTCPGHAGCDEDTYYITCSESCGYVGGQPAYVCYG